MRPNFEKTELIPVIVQDYLTKKVLMQAYTNHEAYDKMIESGETWFYSRSRQKLWHKGEESGCFQKVKGIYLDCDADSLLVFVEQVGGAACHTGEFSCFFNEIQAFDDSNIFQALEAMIEDRKQHPLEKSYTNYLLDQGLDKVLKKVGEEASEVIIASKNSDQSELIGEIADLLYHVFVLMNQCDVSLEALEEKLKERHQKPQNKKEFHTRTEA